MIQEANLHWRYVDTESNLIMPWYTLPALQWLKEQNKMHWIVFEYGCGYSTIWWRLNSCHVFSIDHNKSWAKAMGADFIGEKKEYIERLEFLCTPMGTLATGKTFEPQEENLADCIIVDGEWREECVKFCLPFLKSGGYLIIDNWGQEDFPQDACERTEELLKGWTKVVHKQPNHSTWQTAIFQKP